MTTREPTPEQQLHELITEVLVAWRHAERLASEDAPGTRSYRAARTAAERLHALHAELKDIVGLTERAEVEAQRSPRTQSDLVGFDVAAADAAAVGPTQDRT